MPADWRKRWVVVAAMVAAALLAFAVVVGVYLGTIRAIFSNWR
jgi:hypothetical protein